MTCATDSDLTDINLVTYTRGKIGSHYLIHPDEAFLCPIAPGMYQTASHLARASRPSAQWACRNTSRRSFSTTTRALS